MSIRTISAHNRHLRRAATLVATLLLLLLLAQFPGTGAHAQDLPIVYEHFNTELTLSEDGSVHVRLIQQIRFDGSFSGAFYAIPIENLTSIANVELYGAATESANYELNTVDLEPIEPNFIENDGQEVVIDWNFPRTQPGDVRLFVIEFDAYGVVWVYPERDFISWKAIGEDRSGITVNESEVEITLPDIIPMDQVTVTDNFGGDMISIIGQTITYVAGEPVVDGVPYIVEAHFPHGLLDVGVREWQREYDGNTLQVDIEQFHVDLTINSDGTLNVREDTRVTVIDGALHQGVRELKRLYLDDFAAPSVAINGEPLAEGSGECTGCFVINTFDRSSRWVYLDPQTEQPTINEDNAGLYFIDWYTPLPILPGESITTTIAFQVDGALRVSDENQLLTWQVVPDFDQEVRRASMRLTLPFGVTPDEIVLEGPTEQGSPQRQPDGSLLYVFDGPVVPGTWQIVLTLPADATSAKTPIWQQQFEEVMAQADAAAVARARKTLIQRVLDILAVVGTILVGIFAWFRWGRKRVKEALGGYISEPPSHQSPAMVAYLVDRKASERGVLGTIFYLASLRLLEIDLKGEMKLRRIHNEPLSSTKRLVDVYGESVTIPRHIQLLFDKVLLPDLPLNQWVALDTIAPRLRNNLPEIYAQLAADLQQLYIRVPGSGFEAVPGSLWFFTYAVLLGLMFFEIIPWLTGFILGFVALIIYVAWSAIHETGQGGYSDAAALEADCWRRFKTYLREIKKYGDQGAAQEIIDRYFGYAVAFGVEDVVLSHAMQLGSLEPLWMPGGSTMRSEPSRQQRRTGTRVSNIPWPRSTSQPAPAPDATVQRPTLAGMSASLGDSIRQASRNLGSLLSTAAGDAGASARNVTLNSQLRRREMTWKPNTSVTTILDDILRQSVSDAREIQAREIARRAAARRESTSSSDWNWGSGGGSSSSRSRSSSSFGRSSSSSWGSSSRSSSSSSRSSSSSSSSRSSGGGRSGFR